MERISIDLHPTPVKPVGRVIQRLFLGLFGIINIIQGVLYNYSFRYVNIVFGVAVLVFAIGYPFFYKPKMFSIDDDGIELPKNSEMIEWGNISKIELKILNLIIYDNAGLKRKIYLGNLTFQQLREIKQKISDAAKLKDVEVKAA